MSFCWVFFGVFRCFLCCSWRFLSTWFPNSSRHLSNCWEMFKTAILGFWGVFFAVRTSLLYIDCFKMFLGGVLFKG